MDVAELTLAAIHDDIRLVNVQLEHLVESAPNTAIQVCNGALYSLKDKPACEAKTRLKLFGSMIRRALIRMGV